MAKRYWHIRGDKKFDTVFDETIPVGCLAEDKLKVLLKCLAAKDGLSYEEIIDAYVKRKTGRAHSILEVQGNGFSYFCEAIPASETGCPRTGRWVAVGLRQSVTGRRYCVRTGF
jgi:hypothetical protein